MLLYWKNNWLHLTNITGKGLHRRRLMPEFSFNKLLFNIRGRRSQVLMNRLRIGHIGVREYLYRFRMADGENCENPQCDSEGIVETIEHFILQCPKYQRERSILSNKLTPFGIPLNLKVLLLCDERFKEYHPFILKSFLDFLESIPRTLTYF